MNEKDGKKGDKVTKNLACLYMLALFVLSFLTAIQPVFAQEGAKEKETKKLPAVSPEVVEPFEISPQFKKEEIEPPEIEVTAVMETEYGIVALVKLDLKDYEGTVMLEPGQKVSMPEPESSVTDKWISYFTVKEIRRSGITIVLENGKEAYFPVLGSRD